MTPKPLTAVTVIGLGPAGRIAAHRAAQLGARVKAFDPSGGLLPSTIGVWEHQLPEWVPDSFVRSRFRPHIVLHDGSRRALSATYCIVDNEVFNNLGGFEVVKERLTSDDARIEVGNSLVIDATGGQGAPAIRQIAYGQVFEESALPTELRVGVLMDFRPPVGCSAGSFSYRVPLGDGRWLIEETILATKLGQEFQFATDDDALGWLRDRQRRRLAEMCIDGDAAVGEELVSFPLVPRKAPNAIRVWRNKRANEPMPFGLAGGWMHPATGYSVGNALSGVDVFLGKAGSTPPGGVALWHLRRRGLAALLSFTAEEQAEFFTAFFQLPEKRIFEYLTGASVVGTLRAMGSVAKPLARDNLKLLFGLVSGFGKGG